MRFRVPAAFCLRMNDSCVCVYAFFYLCGFTNVQQISRIFRNSLVLAHFVKSILQVVCFAHDIASPFTSIMHPL